MSYRRVSRTFVLAMPPMALLLLSGCQSLELGREEIAWQAMHAVDVAQTLNIADDPCYVESAYLTQRLIGQQPSETEVLLWGIGTAVGHALVTNLLDRMEAPRWIQKVWSYGTISHTGYTIVDNHREGIRVFGDNEDVDGCYR